MDVFQLRDSVIDDYQGFIQGFLHIRDKRIGCGAPGVTVGTPVTRQFLVDGLGGAVLGGLDGGRFPPGEQLRALRG